MITANDIMVEAEGKLQAAKDVAVKKHCTGAGCQFAIDGNCRIHGVAGVCMAKHNADSFATLNKLCKDTVMLDLVVKARNEMLEAEAQQAEIAALKGGE